MVSGYWKKFENTGKIEDYLSFVACDRQEGKPAEVSDHAGTYFSDGNHIEAVSGGGVRQSGLHPDEGAR